MRKVFTFNKGCSIRATVEIKYDTTNEEKKRLSICGTLYAAGLRCGGQCLDEIAQYIDDEKFKTIYRLWKLYHLNDMHPECEHQAELGWLWKAKQEVKLYTFTMTTEAICAQHKLEHDILDAAKVGKPYYTTAEEQTLLSLSYSRKSHEENLPKIVAGYYKLASVELKALGWLSEKEHPNGILCRPCPTCSYKYGTSWLYRPIPDKDEEIILSILKGA
jgi:hypothetical protein